MVLYLSCEDKFSHNIFYKNLTNRILYAVYGEDYMFHIQNNVKLYVTSECLVFRNCILKNNVEILSLIYCVIPPVDYC